MWLGLHFLCRRERTYADPFADFACANDPTNVQGHAMPPVLGGNGCDCAFFTDVPESLVRLQNQGIPILHRGDQPVGWAIGQFVQNHLEKAVVKPTKLECPFSYAG
jgi:hypothetical protein